MKMIMTKLVKVTIINLSIGPVRPSHRLLESTACSALKLAVGSCFQEGTSLEFGIILTFPSTFSFIINHSQENENTYWSSHSRCSSS